MLTKESSIVEELLDRSARHHPDSAALKIVSTKSLEVESVVSYSELASSSAAVAHALLDMGVQKSQRVALLLEDDLPFAASFLGALEVGAVPILLSTFFSKEQILYLLNDSEAKVVFSEDEYLDKVLDVESGQLKKIAIVSKRGAKATFSFESILKEKSRNIETTTVSDNDMAFWFYTSGSTGVPKAVVHIHRDVRNWSRPFLDQVLRATKDDVFFSGAKLFFSGGLSFGLFSPLLKGATAILYPGRQSAESAIEIIQNAKPTLYYAVPTIYSRILHQNNGAIPDFSSVRMFLTGGEPLGKVIFDQWKNRFGTQIIEAYGAAEFGRCISNSESLAKPGSCGKLLQGFEAKILDDIGNELHTGQTGTLFIKGEGNFSEYWHMTEATKATIHGQWINTRDLFYKDKEGYYYFSGRNDYAFKINGLWASPMEIEEAFLALGLASECCVVPIEDENGLTSLTTFVVRKDSSASIDETRMRQALSKKLSRYKIPKKIVAVESLPRNSIGKLDRGRALELAKQLSQRQ